MSKTLIGKEGWLFLQNDSARELEVHCNNICLVSGHLTQRFDTIKDKYFLTIFPNKSLIMKQFLPDGFEPRFRPAFNIYAEYLGTHILDGLSILTEISDELTYYKTDSHINLFGAYIVYKKFIETVNKVFGLHILPVEAKFNKKTVSNLSSSNLGYGDLTWESNLGGQILISTYDELYESSSIEQLINYYKIDQHKSIQIFDYNIRNKTNEFTEAVLNWEILSKMILYQYNAEANDLTVIIFFDSFLISTLSLYLQLFKQVYLVKNNITLKLIKQINPDLIFEFRVERFLF